MAQRNPLVLINGIPAELPTGDTVTGGGSADSRMTSLMTDFVHTNAVQNDFVGAAVASGTNTTAPAAASLGGDHPGVQLWRSSTTANSGYQCTTALNVFRIAGGEQWNVNFRTAAAFTNTTFRSGALDSITSTASVDGVYFEFAGSGAIVGKCRSNNVETASATIATLSASTWYHGRISVNAAASTITFTIFDDAGTQLGQQTVSTNIPTASGREVGFGSIATNSGTTATDLVNMDRQQLTNPGRTVARGAA